jgi:histidinol-phosphate aminotransferase
MFKLQELLRNNIKNLIPYSSARNEFKGIANLYLDANENSYGSPLATSLDGSITENVNRYPDPYQSELKKAIAALKDIDPECIFLGNGSDECIDLIYRCFCEPRRDNVIICPPTYGMYEVSGNINDIEVRKVPLQPDFQLNLTAIEKQIDGNTKIAWICSPNNPTGNAMDQTQIRSLLENFPGIVVLDEAYVDFSTEPSFIAYLNEFPNLVILQTFSKAWALAGLRLGMAFASKEVIEVFNKVKPPYNISSATQEYVIKALATPGATGRQTASIVKNRNKLAASLQTLGITEKVYASEANFLLVKFYNAKSVYQFLLANGIVVRDRSNVLMCDNCLRLTVGTSSENTMLIDTLKNYAYEYEKSLIS